MTPEPVSAPTIYTVERILRERSIENAFVGGLALSAWGVPHATFDLDLAVSLPDDRQKELLAALAELGWSVDAWPSRKSGAPDSVPAREPCCPS